MSTERVMLCFWPGHHSGRWDTALLSCLPESFLVEKVQIQGGSKHSASGSLLPVKQDHNNHIKLSSTVDII